MNEQKFIKAMEYLFESKLKSYTAKTIEVWFNELKDYPEKEVFEAIKNLIASEDDFITVGKIISQVKSDDKETENAWNEVLLSAQRSGESNISARSAKALNSLGGMLWLRQANPEDVNWQRKEFIAIYEITPEPKEIDFTCIGQGQKQIYLKQKIQKVLS